MFVPNWTSKKRQRDADDSPVALGFSEHRSKRRIAALPHRTPPKPYPHAFPSVFTCYTSQPVPPTITPTDSDSEEIPTINEPKSMIFADPSPNCTLAPGSPGITPLKKAEYNDFDIPLDDSGDFEMTDSILLSPGPFHNESSTSISSRIPTPIHSSFSSHLRAEKVFRHSDPDFIDDETMMDKFRISRDLPSPISEGQASPSVITDGLSGMQMETMEQMERDTPTKKGHSRSKHSLRNWTGFGMDGNINGPGSKRTFSMGYRADCEKCRNKVPGHFSHIITN